MSDDPREQRDWWEEQFRAKVEELAFANKAWRDTYSQLVAAKALCDDLADKLRSAGWGIWLADYDRHRAALNQYDALRNTERANTEKGGTDGVG